MPRRHTTIVNQQWCEKNYNYEASCWSPYCSKVVIHSCGGMILVSPFAFWSCVGQHSAFRDGSCRAPGSDVTLTLCTLPQWRSFAEYPACSTCKTAILSCQKQTSMSPRVSCSRKLWILYTSPNKPLAIEMRSASIVLRAMLPWRLLCQCTGNVQLPLVAETHKPDLKCSSQNDGKMQNLHL